MLDTRTNKILEFTLNYNMYKKALYNYVWKMLDDKTCTEDILQNVFMKYYENIYSIKKSSPANWLFTTARNEVYGLLRKRKVRKEDYFDENIEYASDINITDLVEELEIKDLVEKELSGMDADSKEIFILREYSELSYKEIAEILSVEESIIKGRLFRARQKIIDKISKLVR